MSGKKITVLIVEKEDHVREVLHFIIVSQFLFEIKECATVADAIELFDRGLAFDLVLCDYNLSPKNGGELYLYMVKKGITIPFILTSSSKPQNFKEFKAYPVVKGVDKVEIVTKLAPLIESYFEKIPDAQHEHYAQIKPKLLLRFLNLHEDIYIKLNSGRYLKFYSVGDHISQEDIDRIEAKGIICLFLKKMAAEWILRAIQTKISDFLASPNTKIQLVKPLVDSKGMPFPDNKNSLDSNRPIVDFGASKSQPHIRSETPAPKETVIDYSKEFPKIIPPEVLQLVTEKSLAVKNRIKKSTGLVKALKKMNISREDAKFFETRTELVSHIACSIAKTLEWGTDPTLDKLIYVAHLHDCSLGERSDLAKIITMKEFDENGDKYSFKDRDIFTEHPIKSGELIMHHLDKPVDAELIIAQHHERPDGSGFPRGINGMRIAPLSAIFIVALDFAQYILSNPRWRFIKFVEEKGNIYHGGNFTKVMNALEKISQSSEKD